MFFEYFWHALDMPLILYSSSNWFDTYPPWSRHLIICPQGKSFRRTLPNYCFMNELRTLPAICSALFEAEHIRHPIEGALPSLTKVVLWLTTVRFIHCLLGSICQLRIRALAIWISKIEGKITALSLYCTLLTFYPGTLGDEMFEQNKHRVWVPARSFM